jgi:hypothetical protein
VLLAPARPAAGWVVVRQGGAEVARRPFEARPGVPLAVDAPGGPLEVEVLDAAGRSVLRALLP